MIDGLADRAVARKWMRDGRAVHAGKHRTREARGVGGANGDFPLRDAHRFEG
jgi:hypothetical protein